MFRLPRSRLRPTLRSLQLLSNCSKSPAPPPQLASGLRKYSPYPKEGVFQPNSPPRPGVNQAQDSSQQQQAPSQYQQSPYPPQQPPNPTQNTPSRRFLGSLVLSYLFGSLAFYVGWRVANDAAEGAIPYMLDAEPGSDEDLQAIQALYDQLEEIPFVQQLRSEILVEDGQRKPAFKEWIAYNGFTDGRRDQRLTTGPLAGYNGLAAQFVFWCESTQELYVLINFGPKTCGWPGVVHGGAIATVFDESLGRHAIFTTEERTAVTAQLEIKYSDPVKPGMWYMIAVAPSAEKQSTEKKKYVAAVMLCVGEAGPFRGADDWEGEAHVHAGAEGLFVVPKGVPLSPVPDEF